MGFVPGWGCPVPGDAFPPMLFPPDDDVPYDPGLLLSLAQDAERIERQIEREEKVRLDLNDDDRE